MTTRDTLVALGEQFARLEKALADRERDLIVARSDLRVVTKVAEAWEAPLCIARGCEVRVPLKAHVDLMRVHGMEPGEKAWAWNVGCCSVRCWEAHQGDNVLPFVRAEVVP